MKGTVISSAENYVTVSVRCVSACASCPQKNICGSHEAKEKLYDIPVADSAQYTEGQSVELSVSDRSLYLSMLLAYVLPIVILVTIIGCGTFLGFSDTASALTAIGCLCLYGLLLHCFRKKIEKTVVVHIN